MPLSQGDFSSRDSITLSQAIEPSQEYLQQMQDLIHERDRLECNAFILKQLSRTEVERKRRCKRCTRSPGAGKDKLDCRFHPGIIKDRKWTCCSGNIASSPCRTEEGHRPDPSSVEQLARFWRFFSTPAPGQDADIRKAIVLDCEMGTTRSGESELIRLSVVDYLTCEVLVDSLVLPDVPMMHLNTRFTGITKRTMEQARRENKCILGRRQARSEVWKYVGPNTIVIGHSVQHDLTAMRWIHKQVVDTLLVETDISGATSGLSLKKLAQEKLGRAIQDKKTGHDSLEDSIATRDLLHYNISKLVAGAELAETELAEAQPSE